MLFQTDLQEVIYVEKNYAIARYGLQIVKETQIWKPFVKILRLTSQKRSKTEKKCPLFFYFILCKI